MLRYADGVQAGEDRLTGPAGTIQDLVARLAAHPSVVGLVRYGGRPVDAPAGVCGDFDLFVLVDERPPELESVHFDVGGVPVDLNVRTWPDLERAAQGEPLTPVDDAIFGGEVLHDRDGNLAARLQGFRARSPRAPASPTKEVVAFVRFGHRHALDKVRGRLETEPVLCRLVLEANLYWLVANYFRVRGLPFPGERAAMDHLERHEPGVWGEILRFYAAGDLPERAAISEALGERVLAPVGGPRGSGEVLALGAGHGGEHGPAGRDLQAVGCAFLRGLLAGGSAPAASAPQ